MLLEAARSVAGLVDSSTPGAPLLPQVEDLPATSAAVAAAVARAAQQDGVAGVAVGEDVEDRVRRLMWKPTYRPVIPA
jgi:malate dehydrogenase (oxaloacetate-decarboxylating)